MPTLGNDGICKLLPTDQASERDLLLLVVGNVVSSESFGFHRFGVLFVHLPAGEVVSSLRTMGRESGVCVSVREGKGEEEEEERKRRLTS